MMRRVAVLMAAVLWAASAWGSSYFLGIRKTTSKLVFEIDVYDTVGIQRNTVKPDSFDVEVHSDLDSAMTLGCYYARSGNTNPEWIRRTWRAGDSMYVFMDSVADVDGDKGNGVYTGAVRAWVQGRSCKTSFSFTLAAMSDIGVVARMDTTISSRLHNMVDTLHSLYAQSKADSIRTMLALPGIAHSTIGGLPVVAGGSDDGVILLATNGLVYANIDPAERAAIADSVLGNRLAEFSAGTSDTTLGAAIAALRDSVNTYDDNGINADVTQWRNVAPLPPTTDGSIIADLDSVSAAGGAGSVSAYELSQMPIATVTTATNVTTVNGLAADVITAASIATGAIGATEFAAETDIVSAGAITTSSGAVSTVTTTTTATNVTTVSSGGITAASIADGSIDSATFANDAKTMIAKRADSSGAGAWAYSTRTLTALDEDVTTLDLNATAVGSVAGAVASVTAAVGITPGSIDSLWNEDSTGHYTSPRMAFVASQTGSSTGLDSATTSRIMKRVGWGIVVGDGASSDSVAATLRYIANPGGSSSGTGTKPETLYVCDTLGPTRARVASVKVTLQNSTNSNTSPPVLTANASGYVIFTTNPSTTYNAYAEYGGYFWPVRNFTTSAGSAAGMDSISGWDMVPSNTAPGVQKTTLYETAIDQGGNTLPYAKVTITLNGSSEAYTTTNVVLPAQVVAKANSSGLWQVAIVGNDSIFVNGTGGTTSYNVKIEHSSLAQPVEYKNLFVPANGATTRLRSLLP